jgi:hypothetical protein
MRMPFACIAILAALTLAGCLEGPSGAKGDKGDRGEQGAVGPAGPVGSAGPAGPLASQSLRPVRMSGCPEDRCEMSCNAQEELVSATCLGGQIGIDGIRVTCSNTQGAIALCVRR